MIGLKNVWVKQRQKIHYTGGEFHVNTAHIYDRYDYWGFGIRGGLESEWSLKNHFYLQGLFNAALLYGFFKIDHKERL